MDFKEGGWEGPKQTIEACETEENEQNEKESVDETYVRAAYQKFLLLLILHHTEAFFVSRIFIRAVFGAAGSHPFLECFNVADL